mgnify:CR=1 FL=1
MHPCIGIEHFNCSGPLGSEKTALFSASWPQLNNFMKVYSQPIFANASQNVLGINAGILAFACASCGNLGLF